MRRIVEQPHDYYITKNKTLSSIHFPACPVLRPEAWLFTVKTCILPVVTSLKLLQIGQSKSLGHISATTLYTGYLIGRPLLHGSPQNKRTKDDHPAEAMALAISHQSVLLE